VSRASHPDDRRQSIISITAGGEQLLDEETRARDEWLTERLVEFSDAERKVLVDAIEVLNRLGSE
jgi:DNA-binding MarR family transcriptional regulator